MAWEDELKKEKKQKTENFVAAGVPRAEAEVAGAAGTAAAHNLPESQRKGMFPELDNQKKDINEAVDRYQKKKAASYNWSTGLAGGVAEAAQLPTTYTATGARKEGVTPTPDSKLYSADAVNHWTKGVPGAWESVTQSEYEAQRSKGELPAQFVDRGTGNYMNIYQDKQGNTRMAVSGARGSQSVPAPEPFASADVVDARGSSRGAGMTKAPEETINYDEAKRKAVGAAGMRELNRLFPDAVGFQEKDTGEVVPLQEGKKGVPLAGKALEAYKAARSGGAIGGEYETKVPEGMTANEYAQQQNYQGSINTALSSAEKAMKDVPVFNSKGQQIGTKRVPDYEARARGVKDIIGAQGDVAYKQGLAKQGGQRLALDEARLPAETKKDLASAARDYAYGEYLKRKGDSEEAEKQANKVYLKNLDIAKSIVASAAKNGVDMPFVEALAQVQAATKSLAGEDQGNETSSGNRWSIEEIP
jgi:hypothetical protein